MALLFLVPLTLSGCLKSSFKPIPPYYQLWSKPGASPLNVKVALLECGWPSPSPSGYGADVASMSANDKTLADLCMEKSGFISKDPFNGYRQSRTCNAPWTAKFPACQPDAVIPTRSVERRLNSEYCKTWGKPTLECQALGTQPAQPLPPVPAQDSIRDPDAPAFEYPDQPTQLQQQMQFDSRHDMNQMLKNTTPVNRR